MDIFIELTKFTDDEEELVTQLQHSAEGRYSTEGDDEHDLPFSADDDSPTNLPGRCKCVCV